MVDFGERGQYHNSIIWIHRRKVTYLQGREGKTLPVLQVLTSHVEGLIPGKIHRQDLWSPIRDKMNNAVLYITDSLFLDQQASHTPSR